MKHTNTDPHSNVLQHDNGSYAYVYQGDCRTLGGLLPNESCDMVFADPPFNIGEDYGVWCDKMTPGEFIVFTQEWLDVWSMKLKPNGVFIVHVPDEMVYNVLNTMRVLDFRQVDWVIWHYKFGQYNPNGWTRSKCHCLVFARHNSQVVTFHASQQIESDRSRKYGDNRAANGGFRTPFDVWSCDNDGPGWGRVCGTYNEKIQGHPNQLPCKYIERLISTYTAPGDFVADPFGGTGTTAKVATDLGRHVFTSDVNLKYVNDIVDRLMNKEL